MKYKLGQKVKVPMQFGYAPCEGVIIKFYTNSYGVECADVKINNSFNGVRSVAISSLDDQAKKDKEEKRREMLKKMGVSEKFDYQLRALERWEFEYNQKSDTFSVEVDDLKICWNLKKQAGAFYLDGELMFIHDWEMFDDIMSQTAIY